VVVLAAACAAGLVGVGLGDALGVCPEVGIAGDRTRLLVGWCARAVVSGDGRGDKRRAVPGSFVVDR
jgi:hypothetical protein